MLTNNVTSNTSDRPTSAAAVKTYDVEAVNRKEDRSLYASRQKIYPKLAHGAYRRLKWILMAVTLGIYYLIPWIRWDRGPDLPSQAVLLDMANERFFLFGLEIWPQEFYIVTGLLVLAALLLFVVTSIAGRVWCGYFCPQTVWTDLMISVERFWQGDRNARMRLDKAKWGAEKIFKKLATHVTWLVIAVATGGAFIFYFADAPTLLRQLFAGTAAIEAYVFLGLFTLTTYVLGGIAREQVCIYMCPWPRIQGAMIDQDTFLVGYRDLRGEPRGSHRKNESWEGRGDCVDCKACVAVCPMGIDIRDGSQLECIQCALCIDACDEIMARVGRPPRLIAYETIANQEAALKGKTATPKIFRPRTLIYLALIAFVSVLLVWALATRSLLEVNVLPDRNPYFVQLSNGDIRNSYTVKILNKLHEPRTFDVQVAGAPGAVLRISGNPDGDTQVTVPTDVLREIRAFVVVPKENVAELKAKGERVTFIVTDRDSGRQTRRLTRFRGPSQ